ncbi:peptidoglycan DD-metalloendopeptidase family protein [Winogradskyella litorisediminis]|uniref:Peptidoglycan DD-metalloendopeptidase family protein n=1 Tax=Winogradskyella litorisediminis TaxID=1156618 RepID=A0ABW3N5L1_9FLAO
MKFVLASLFSFSLCIALAQETKTDSIKIQLNSVAQKGLVNQEIAIPIISTENETSEIVSINSEFWDNVNVNPYRNEIIQYPLYLNFTDSTFAAPVLNKNVVTSRYGWRRGRPHNGIDLDLVTGDSVAVILDGIVRLSRYSRTLGNVVIVRHYNGLETTYAHLSERHVKVNDAVLKGQVIGKGGNTGRSTGSHLHFVASYKGQYIHPEYIFDFSEEHKIRAQDIWITKEWTRASFHNSRKRSKLKLFTTEEAALASLVKTRKVYIVKSGDTLSRISNQNNVSIRSICKVNSIRKTSTLKIGQKLILEM